MDKGTINMSNTLPASGQDSRDSGSKLPEGWTRPTLEKLPEPTYWPMVLAFGVIFALGGIVTSYIVSLVGVGVIAIAIAGWIGDLRHDRRN